MFPPQPPPPSLDHSYGRQQVMPPVFGQTESLCPPMSSPMDNSNFIAQNQFSSMPPVEKFASMSLNQQYQQPQQQHQQYQHTQPNAHSAVYSQSDHHSSQGTSQAPAVQFPPQPYNSMAPGSNMQSQAVPHQYTPSSQMSGPQVPYMTAANAPLMPPLPPMTGGYSGVSTAPTPGMIQQDVYRAGNYPPQSLVDPSFQGRQYNQPPQPPFPNGPMGAPPAPAPKRISSEGLPSVVEVVENNRTQCSGPFYTGQRGVAPPLVTTDFSCRDEGNCNPRFIRSSLYAVPTTPDLLKTVGIPFSLTVSPFAKQHPDDPRILVSDMGEPGPVRCTRCRGYMSPFVSFIDGGRRFQCPLCNGLTEVPEQYFAHLDHTGRRTDAYHRPELCLGSYELLATTEYCKNNELPKPPAFIFILDVSQSAVRSGLVQLFCSNFTERILPHLPTDECDPDSMRPSPIRLGFITYDHQIHFYTLTREQSSDESLPNGSGETQHMGAYSKPQMNIVADVDEVFVPAVEGFLIPSDAVAVQNLLQMIPTQFHVEANAGVTGVGLTSDALLGPAIQAGLEALRAANRSGKLFVFHCNLPTTDAPGKLKNRDDRRLVGTEKERTLLTPVGDFYTGLGQVCVEAGCSVDLFLFPNSFVDVATLSEVPRITAGHVYKYNCFQAACLYTSLSGQRRLRIHNLSLSTTSSIPEIFRIAELDTHMNWLGKFAMRALCSRAHQHVVDEMTSKAAHTLAAYRRHCSGGPGDVGASPGELVLPQNMKLFPLYVQCLMKTDAFMPADNVSIDERAWLMFLLNGMDVKQSNALFYPRLYPVHNLAPNFEGNVYPPPAIRCSYEYMQPDGAYLLDNGLNLFLWLGATLNADWIQAIFNVTSARQFEPEKIYDLPRLPNETSRNLCHLIDQIHLEHSRHTRLLVVRPGDPMEGSFKRFLVEDRYSGNSVSYMEYLCHIHKEVFSLLR
ncbi:Transport protein Sec24D [Fasciola hepatica]|uniref:Transport protein Sec24D n=1 Tax=Fasciola hepatica TaxID=6192 RepID=A0A4E0RYC8_FASHE|nr:Transport protein Sec24D [Fasciola hepatica]